MSGFWLLNAALFAAFVAESVCRDWDILDPRPAEPSAAGKYPRSVWSSMLATRHMLLPGYCEQLNFKL